MVTGEPKPLEGFREASLQGMLAVTLETPLCPLCPNEARRHLPPGAVMLTRSEDSNPQMESPGLPPIHLLAQPGFPSSKAAANLWFAQHHHGSFRGLGSQLLCPSKASSNPLQLAFAQMPTSFSPCRLSPACLLAAGDVGIRSSFAHANSASVVGHCHQ